MATSEKRPRTTWVGVRKGVLMLRRLLPALLVCLLYAMPSYGYEAYTNWCQQGGSAVVIAGTPGSSTQRFQQTYRGCTVTVYAAGTVTLSTLYSDTSGTALANPFTANSTTGYFTFYAAPGNYDVRLSGGGLAAAFTIGNVRLGETTVSCANFPGSTAGAKIAACITALPSAGGIADARGITGAQTISQNMFSSATMPVQLLMGCGTYTISVTQRPYISGTQIVGSGACTVLKAGAATVLIQIDDNSTGSFPNFMKVSDVKIDCNSSGTVGLRFKNTHNSMFRDSAITACTSIGLDVQDEIYELTLDSNDIYSNAINFKLSNPNSTNADKVTSINSRYWGATAENVLIDGSLTAGAINNPVFIGGEYEGGTKGIAGSVVRNLGIYGGHFENSTTANIDLYKPSVSSTSFASESMRIDGAYLQGGSVGAMAIQCKGCISALITGIYTDTHTATGSGSAASVINFDNAGLTNITNYGNVLMNPVISESAGPLLSLTQHDGLTICGVHYLGNTGEPNYACPSPFDSDLLLSAPYQASGDFSTTRSVKFTGDPPVSGTVPTVLAEMRWVRDAWSSGPGQIQVYTTNTAGALNKNWSFLANRHLEYSTASHLVSTGTNDISFQLTILNGATVSDTKTFVTAWASAPNCTATPNADPVGRVYFSTLSTTQAILTSTSATGGNVIFNVHCIGNPN